MSNAAEKIIQINNALPQIKNHKERLTAELNKTKQLWILCKEQDPYPLAKFSNRTKASRKKAMFRLESQAKQLEQQIKEL